MRALVTTIDDGRGDLSRGDCRASGRGTQSVVSFSGNGFFQRSATELSAQLATQWSGAKHMLTNRDHDAEKAQAFPHEPPTTSSSTISRQRCRNRLRATLQLWRYCPLDPIHITALAPRRLFEGRVWLGILGRSPATSIYKRLGCLRRSIAVTI